jgi:hypothetical protein
MEYSKRPVIIDAIEMISANSNIELKHLDRTIQIWHISLKDFTDQQIMWGVQKVLDRSEPFMPTIGQFKELAMTGSGVENIEDEALEAWRLVVQNLNAYVSPVFKNAAIAETLRGLGGWVAVCRWKTDELQWRQKDFVAMYKIYRKRGGDYLPELSGINDPEFKFIGYSHDEDTKQIEQELKKGVEFQREAVKKLTGG